PPSRRSHVLREMSETGHLPTWAVDAVLATLAGHTPRVPPPSPLTQREREVLALVARGATNRAVSAALRISPKTVNAHLEHVFAKLGVSTRGAAVYHALAHGLLDVTDPP